MSSLWSLFPHDIERRNANLTQCPLTGQYSCDNKYPECYNPRGLDFNTTQIITSLINCPDDPRIFKVNGKPNPYGLINGTACHTIAGDSYTLYPALDVVDRLTSWKLPLLQLVFLTPRPPLGRVWVSLFVLLRLLGNPGGTIQNYVIKIASCHGRAKFWQAAFCEEGALYHVVDEPRDPGERDRRSPSDSTAQVGPPPTNDPLQGNASNSSADTPRDDDIDGDKESLKRRKRFQRQERLWKSLAIIIDSYDEWGRRTGDDAEKMLFKELKGLEFEDQVKKDRILKVCLSTAEALAADRRTLVLPMASAMFLFYVSIALAMLKTWLAGAHSPGFYLNIEAYSIGFSALYFWIFSAEILAGIIGTSDSEDRIPRILNRFKDEIASLPDLPVFELHEDDSFRDRDTTTSRLKDLDACRRFSGGIYSWHPLMWNRNNEDITKIRNEAVGIFEDGECYPYEERPNSDKPRPYFDGPRKTWIHKNILSPGTSRFTWLIITTGFTCGCAICALVPPGGYNCRHTWLIVVYGVWILSWLLDGNGLQEDSTEAQKIKRAKAIFLYHFVKDTLSTAATFGGIMVTQFGILNKCDCYTFANGHPKALHLPQLAPASGVLEKRFKTAYLPLVLAFVALNLALYPSMLIWAYHEGVRVFIQRDDSQSNFGWGQDHRFKHHADRELDHQDRPQRQSTGRMEANVSAAGSSRLQQARAKVRKYFFSPIWAFIKEFTQAVWSIIVRFLERLWAICRYIFRKCGMLFGNKRVADGTPGYMPTAGLGGEHDGIPLDDISGEHEGTAVTNE